jgi:hypothetical protein
MYSRFQVSFVSKVFLSMLSLFLSLSSVVSCANTALSSVQSVKPVARLVLCLQGDFSYLWPFALLCEFLNWWVKFFFFFFFSGIEV